MRIGDIDPIDLYQESHLQVQAIPNTVTWCVGALLSIARISASSHLCAVRRPSCIGGAPAHAFPWPRRLHAKQHYIQNDQCMCACSLVFTMNPCRSSCARPWDLAAQCQTRPSHINWSAAPLAQFSRQLCKLAIHKEITSQFAFWILFWKERSQKAVLIIYVKSGGGGAVILLLWCGVCACAHGGKISDAYW